jgi:dTDP-4-dehydrorhamnose reductase
MNLPAENYPVLVTGARGLLGSVLAPRLARGAPRPDLVTLTDIQELDVTDAGAVEAMVRRVGPRTVFHLAAWTDVDKAESHPAEAMRLNADAAENVARAAAGAGATVVHVSTDFIFDGLKAGVYVEDDPPTPVSVYGSTKLEGERRVRAAAPGSHVIARTAWLYGAGARNFIHAILAAAKKGGPLRVVTDQVGCPTWNEDLADALVALAGAGVRGTFHAAGGGEASRLAMAREILDAAGLDVPLEGCLTADLPPRPARRPVRSVLSTEKLRQAAGFTFPPWQESLRACVRAISPR